MLKISPAIVISLSVFITFCQPVSNKLNIKKGSRIVLLGNNLGSRMMNFGHFETELQMRYPDSLLIIRNMCDGGDTPGFRPHSGRMTPWAFPGAEKFQNDLAQNSGSEGHFDYPDQWLTRLQADIIIAFFGFNESFESVEGLTSFKSELEGFIDHTLKQQYNGTDMPQLALVTPIAFQDLSDRFDLPKGTAENQNLAMYTEAVKEVCAAKQVLVLDAFTPSKKWFDEGMQLTTDGSQLNETGYARFSKLLVDGVFGDGSIPDEDYRPLVNSAVLEKNWFWHNDVKIPNGVHVFGRRYDPFGPDNYPTEIRKIREMTSIRDTAIWMALNGEEKDLEAADQKTTPPPKVETNFTDDNYGRGNIDYLYGKDALDKFEMAPGYKISLFASEKEFPDLANPVQLSFDNKGRLWVAVMPSYPHYAPGDSRPNDKLLILEDTNRDGVADKETIFADGLHLPIGFEFAPEGIYISQGTNLKLLSDTDGDDKADKAEIIFSGFDDHDTHHAISAFCADPSGAIYMAEGVFLHTNVETPYGPVRGTNGGFYRFNPKRRHLERTAQLSIPNPWGIAFDAWGQNFFAETSGPKVHWMQPGTIKPKYGIASPKSANLIQQEHLVRPTSGLEFVSSRHFPANVQGDLLVNNTIGFLGTKQHTMADDGTGYKSQHRQDLVKSTDTNFRPVDMEFAPDGSLYMVDWHNVLIGHMQHNARDPLRDHVHGRIYRITYPSRPLVEPAEVAGASIATLLDNLQLPEYRTRYRSRRELRGRDTNEVLNALNQWTSNLDQNDPKYEQLLLEALWVSWGLNKIDQALLTRLIVAKDHKVRAAATRVIRYNGHTLDNQVELLTKMAGDEHGRVRLEAIVAATWLENDQGLAVLQPAASLPVDNWMAETYGTALARLSGQTPQKEPEDTINTNLQGEDRALFTKGKSIYEKEGYCITCHQMDGKGLPASGFPPLAGTRWAQGNEERLIKLTLNGMMGPINVLEKQYPGQVPMTPFRGLLDNEEVAAVLTYVRNSFGNVGSVIDKEKVKLVRSETEEKSGFYSPEELLKLHPN